jgi:preprotein translocase subunit SecE
MKQKGTVVAISFALFGALSAYVLHLAFSSSMASLRWANAALLGERITTSVVLGIIGGVGLAAGLYGWIKSRSFVGETVVELDKVHWPTAAETRVNAMVVIATSVIAAFIIGCYDLIFAQLSGALAKTNWHF